MRAELFQKGLATLRSRYPDLARHQEAFLAEALRLAGSKAPQGEQGACSCGCLFFLLMTLLAMAASN
jgi:hypothetical protein